MITKTFEFSVAAGAASSNLMPSQFNPVPADGVLDVYGLLDGAISGLTAPPTVSLQLGGDTETTPVVTSSVTGTPNTAGAAGSYMDPSVCPIAKGIQVRKGTNTQLNVAGGTGATATGRFRVVFRTMAEVQAGVGA